MNENLVKTLAKDLGGTIEEMRRLPDGSGFAVMSMPLPKNHWLTAEGDNHPPPAPFLVGTGQWITVTLTREKFVEALRAAGRYAVRASTDNGKENDFDPDAMVGNFVIGLLGLYTPDGLSHVDDKPL